MFYRNGQPNSVRQFSKIMYTFPYASTNGYSSRFRSGYSSVANKIHLLIFSLNFTYLLQPIQLRFAQISNLNAQWQVIAVVEGGG